MRTLSLCLVALAFAAGCQTKTTARGPKPPMEPLPSTGIGTTNPSGIAPVDNTGASAGTGSMPLGGIGGGPVGPVTPRSGTITKPTEVIKIDESGGRTSTENYPTAPPAPAPAE
ncbi:MAG: hypothetical protein ACXWUG_18930, partial [Polyangiales bacterium]